MEQSVRLAAISLRAVLPVLIFSVSSFRLLITFLMLPCIFLISLAIVPISVCSLVSLSIDSVDVKSKEEIFLISFVIKAIGCRNM